MKNIKSWWDVCTLIKALVDHTSYDNKIQCGHTWDTLRISSYKKKACGIICS